MRSMRYWAQVRLPLALISSSDLQLEIAQNDVVEVPCGLLGDVLDPGTILGIGIAEGLEAIALIAGPGDATEGLHATGRKERLRFLDRIAVH
jgi:hypothetical protein